MSQTHFCDRAWGKNLPHHFKILSDVFLHPRFRSIPSLRKFNRQYVLLPYPLRQKFKKPEVRYAVRVIGETFPCKIIIPESRHWKNPIPERRVQPVLRPDHPCDQKCLSAKKMALKNPANMQLRGRQFRHGWKSGCRYTSFCICTFAQSCPSENSIISTSCFHIFHTGNLQGRDHHPGEMRPPGCEDGKSERIRAAGIIYHERHWRAWDEASRIGAERFRKMEMMKRQKRKKTGPFPCGPAFYTSPYADMKTWYVECYVIKRIDGVSEVTGLP